MKIRLLNQYFTVSELWRLRRSCFSLFLSFGWLPNMVRVYLAMRRKATRVTGLPCAVMVEPCSYCDMACPMCPVILNQSKRPRVCLAFDTFKKLIDEIGRELLLITFWNFGEPLLNPDLFRMIRLAKSRRIFCAVSSNLLALAPERAEEMIASNLDYLIVSFDGASEETYEKFRGRGNYRTVVGNLENLLALRKKKRSAHPFINLQFIVMKENEHEIPAIREFARKMGVDKLSLKKFTYISEATRHFLPGTSEYVLGKYQKALEMEFCARPWTSTVLSADGEIIPCCGDLNFEHRFGNLGDPNSSFREIWNGERYVKFRSAVADDINSISMCRTCPSTDYTTDMFIE